MRLIIKPLLSFAGLILIFIIWFLGSWLTGEYILPAPWTSFYDALYLLSLPASWKQIFITLERILAGFGLALSAGVVAGILMGTFNKLSALVKPLVLIIQGVPPLLWVIPLSIILRGSFLTPVVVIALIAFPTVAITISEGVKSVPGNLEQMLTVFAPGRRAWLRELIFPYLKPFLISAVKIALVLGIKASIVAEFFAANNGIGFQIQVAYQSWLIRKLFAWGIIFISLILLINFILERWDFFMHRSRVTTDGYKYRFLRNLRFTKEELKIRMVAQSHHNQSIVLEHVCFHYSHKNDILQDLNLHLTSDDLAIITGESGAGKTTLLLLIAGLLKAQQGEVRKQRQLGLVFQDDRFLPWRNNLWNVALPLLYRKGDRQTAFTVAYHLLQEVGLAEEAFNYPDELSGGMKKRLAFARCFAALPDAILMDEPFSSLHANARTALWQNFFDLLALHPVPAIVVTHYPEEVPVTDLFNVRFYELAVKAGQLAPLKPDHQVS